MEALEKNVYFDDVEVVYQSTINGDDADDLFLTKDEAIKWTKEALDEYCLEDDAEDYIEEIKLNPTKDLRAATDENGKLIIEFFNELDGEWQECGEKEIIFGW